MQIGDLISHLQGIKTRRVKSAYLNIDQIPRPITLSFPVHTFNTKGQYSTFGCLVDKNL